MTIAWKGLKNSTAKRLRCTSCDAIAMEVRAEPVKKKRHTMTGTRRRIIARCLRCRATKVIVYGGRAPG